MVSDQENALRDWIAEASPEQLERLDESWTGHARRPTPVVTLHGAYNTGKSSLLRRVLVDAGQPVPEWLAIAGAPVSFRYDEAEALGVVLRDSPGIDPGAADPRIALHNDEAKLALAATDAVLLTFLPQLPTGDLQEIVALLQQDWPDDALILVVGRFDMALDPADNPDGYVALADRRRQELRAILGLSDGARIHVVAQDPYGEGQANDLPESTVWDEFRAWDGMAELTSRIGELPSKLTQLRTAAQSRFWTQAAADVRRSLQATRDELLDGLAFAESDLKRRDSRLKSLDVSHQSTQADLEQIVEESVRAAAQSSLTVEQAQHNLQVALDAWYSRTQIEIAALIGQVDEHIDTERNRPSFHRFTEFLNDLAGNDAEAVSEAGGAKERLDFYSKVAQSVLTGTRKLIESEGRTVDQIKKERLEAAKAARAARQAATRASAASKSASEFPIGDKLFGVFAIADSLLPAAKEIGDLLVDNYATRQAADDAAKRRRELQEIQRARSSEAAELAMSVVQPDFDQAEAAIRQAAAGSVDMIPPLTATLSTVDAHLEQYPGTDKA